MKSLNNILILFYIFVCVMIVSCSETPGEVTTISFNPNAEIRCISETGVIKKMKLVKLESDSCAVGKIDKIICNDSLLYIMDAYITNEVYVFTQEGRFVSKISRRGHGKYEYTQLSDIFFDTNNNTLCLLSRDDQKVISFTPDGKKVLGESRLPKAFSHMVPTTDGYIGYMLNCSQNPSMPYNVWTLDKSFSLLDGYIPIDRQLESRSNDGINTLSTYVTKSYFKPEYVNTIYQIENGKVCERYKLDFGEKTFPDLSSVSHEDEDEWSKLDMEKIANIYNYEETDDYILMDFVMDGLYRLGVYYKHNQTSEITSLDSYENEYLLSFGWIKGMDQSAIYSVVEYEDVYDVWVGHDKYTNYEEEFPNQVNNLRKLFPKLEENGNPFIAIYSLK